ncbi:MAG: hypothetical protein P1T08_01230 [Acidimicrobiia bacterium]|nr:hypothetical protein [Acidimicrobiia bacterium]
MPGEPSGDHRTPGDWQGVGDLVALATERLTAPVEGMHNAIADRWFGIAGPGAASGRKAYRALTASIYQSVRFTGSVLGAAVGIGAAIAGSRKRTRPLWHSGPGRGIQSTVNAVWGDELERRSSNLSIELSLRDSAGEPIRTDPASLSLAYADPTPRLAVLLHGLGETERCFQGRAEDEGATPGMGDILAADSFTPLLVRYNTGKHVSDNGVALASLLEETVRSWPVGVEEVVLVGNSMGGLLARSTVHAGFSAEHRWTGLVGHVVTLGSPHLGAPLEKGANLIAWALSFVQESRPLSEFINQRSAGIKDLRFGAIREADWRGSDPDALWRDLVEDFSLPGAIEQHFITGVVTTEPRHPVGVLFGDLIVRSGSGIGRGRRRLVEATDVRVLGGRRHFDLLHDPLVQEQVRAWLRAS